MDTSGVLAGKTVTAIAASYYHSCAVADGQAYCWGFNYERLGNNSTTNSHVPVPVDTSGVLAGKTVTAITASATHTCAVADGRAYCWGTNHSGQLGNSSIGYLRCCRWRWTPPGCWPGRRSPRSPPGYDHSCAVADGRAYCWGRNHDGQLGNNTTTDSLVPVAVDTSGVLAGKTVTAITAGHSRTCAVADGRAFCWGDNAPGSSGTTAPLIRWCRWR